MENLVTNHNHPEKPSQEMSPEFSVSSINGFYERNVVTLKPEDTIQTAAKLMLDNHIGNIVVCDHKNAPVGIITDRDIVLNSTAKNFTPAAQTVADVMTNEVECASEDTDINELVKNMVEKGISRIPIVTNSGELKGILTSKRVFQFFARGLCELSMISKEQQQRETSLH